MFDFKSIQHMSFMWTTWLFLNVTYVHWSNYPYLEPIVSIYGRTKNMAVCNTSTNTVCKNTWKCKSYLFYGWMSLLYIYRAGSQSYVQFGYDLDQPQNTSEIQRKFQKIQRKSDHFLFFRFKILKWILTSLKSGVHCRCQNGTFDTHINKWYFFHKGCS